MLRPCLADLHVHTVVSPCAEVEMIPPLIVRQALTIGLQLLAVTDHNTCRNVAAMCGAAAGTGLAILPGMELQTREEVHLLCLFETVEQAEAWQVEVYGLLPDLRNPEEHLGPQFVVDAQGEYLATEERLLLTSADLSLDEAVRRVHTLGGLAIPAHVDRSSFSLLANLGMIPPGLSVDGMELSRHSDPARAVAMVPELGRYSLVSGGDAHQLDEIGNRTRFKVASPCFSEVQLALARLDARKVTVD